MWTMKRRLAVHLITVLAAAALTGTAAASCILTTSKQQRAHAAVIFDGVALENPTSSGVQRFRVTHYLKGNGPRVVRVNTGFVKRPDGTGSITSVSLMVHRGERWRINSRDSAGRILRTTACDGSRKL